jgi:molecular chaperone DnaJ
MGERGPSSAGDLYVFINVRPHAVFTREDEDVYLEAPISFSQAALGAEIEVPTLNGKAKLRIPEGTQTHAVFRMRGEGMPRISGRGKGDQLVRVIIRTPTGLSSKERKALEELGEGDGKKGIFDKMFR